MAPGMALALASSHMSLKDQIKGQVARFDALARPWAERSALHLGQCVQGVGDDEQDDGQPDPDAERRLRGEGVQKELIYRLEAGVAYRLEISAVAEAQVGLMVIAEPAP